jgi:hypothetical protein
MKRIISLILFFLLQHQISLYAQNNSLQLGNGVITLNKGAVITVNQTSPDGITRNNGYIFADGESNRIAWTTNNATGTYSIPFGTFDGDYIPVQFQKTTGGTSSTSDGTIIVSTYHTSENSQPFPSNSNAFFPIVNNVNNPAGVDNSANLADRFWLVCFLNYNTNPSLTLSLNYDVDGVANDLNSLSESDFTAQFWNGSAWDSQQKGIADPGNNAVNNITGVNYNAAWVLVNKNSPLPVELTNFDAKCDGNDVKLSWTTTSEINSDFFTIEKSSDMLAWKTIGIITSAGNSNEEKNYSFIDSHKIEDENYYRLSETDFDGTTKYFNTVTVQCDEQEDLSFTNIFQNSSGTISVDFTGKHNEKYSLQMYDITGKLISEAKGEQLSGLNHVSFTTNAAGNAIYMIVLTDDYTTVTKKIILQK